MDGYLREFSTGNSEHITPDTFVDICRACLTRSAGTMHSLNSPENVELFLPFTDFLVSISKHFHVSYNSYTPCYYSRHPTKIPCPDKYVPTAWTNANFWYHLRRCALITRSTY